MKLLLLGLGIVAFAASSASAECSFGMAKMSKGTPVKHIAQSHKVKTEADKPLEFAALKDAWLINMLNKT